MSLYSFLLLISGSYPFLLIVILMNMFRVFEPRQALDDKEVPRFAVRDTKFKDYVKPGIDLISNLPSSMIHKILRYMPLHDAVRTSVLSREWRLKWRGCSELMFDFRFDQRFLKGHKLESVISDILSHHQGPLQKFVLQAPGIRTCTEIDEWIQLLPSDTLQDLNLQISIGAKHKLTSRLFDFWHLRNLKLDNCAFILPPGFKGLTKLVSLDLYNVGLVPERFGEFIAACPSIASLRLIHCTAFDCFDVTGPKLKFLEFVGLFRSVSFKNCPILLDVRLNLSSMDIDEAKGFSSDLVKSLSCLPKLEELHLQASALENLDLDGALYKLPSALTSLKILHLTEMNFESTTEISCAIYFIRSCPILQRLKITAFNSEVVDSVSVAESLRPRKTPETWTHLKFVRMLRFGGTESEMEFVKHILASTKTLEELAIASSISDGGESILAELKQYPRASPSMEFIHL